MHSCMTSAELVGPLSNSRNLWISQYSSQCNDDWAKELREAKAQSINRCMNHGSRREPRVTLRPMVRAAELKDGAVDIGDMIEKTPDFLHQKQEKLE